MRVAVLFAMRAEAAPLVEALGASREPPGDRLPVERFRAARGPLDVIVSVAGLHPRHGVDSIGPVAAAVHAQDTLARFAPDLVVSAGTAGGYLRHGAALADVFLSAAPFVFHDHRIAIPGFDRYGEGAFPHWDATALAARLGLKLGRVTTGSSLDETDVDRARIAESGAAVKEMEAAAVGYVAELHGVPLLAVKAVTDLVDGPHATEVEFVANLGRASRALADATLRVLDALAEAPLGRSAARPA